MSFRPHLLSRPFAALLAGLLGVFFATTVFAAESRDRAECKESTDPDRRIAACTRLLASSRDPHDRISFLNDRGRAWGDKENYDEARADFDEAIRIDPKWPKVAAVYQNRANTWFWQRDFDRAIADYSEAIRLDPKYFYAWQARGQMWLNRGFPDRAISDFNVALKLYPNWTMVLEGRARAWQAKRDFNRAMTDFNEIIRIAPKYAEGYSFRAALWRDLGDLDRAIADESKAIEIAAANTGWAYSYMEEANAYASRGEYWRLKGDLDQAIADQDQAIKLNPEGSLAQIRRGDTLRYKGEFAAALASYDAALRHSRDDVAAIVGRALTFERMGDPQRARSEFERVLASPFQARVGVYGQAVETARARLAALDSGASLPVIPPAPAKSTATSIPTPQLTMPSVVSKTASRDRRVALVIGNSGYTNVPALSNPQHDADAMAAMLRAIGFDKVTLANNVTRDQMVEALRAFAGEAEKADWAVVYYAGHGMEMSGVNYLVPVDARVAADRDAQTAAVPLDQVMVSVEGAKKLRLILLDACRDNPFAPLISRTTASVSAAAPSSAGGVVGSRSIGRGLGEVKVIGATLVVYAAKHGEVALDGEGANSPFAIAVVQRLPTPGVEINKLFRLVRDDVMEATAGRQEPYTYGSLPGREDFFFVAR